MKAQPSFWAIVVLLAVSASAGTYSGGDGSPENPYRIATAEDMNEIGANPDDWDAHFLLIADINLADYTGTQFNIIGTSYTNAFTGVFDGNSHTISNFTYESNDADYIGLFGYVDDPNAIIKDLTLTDPNVNVAGASNRVGCLVGYLRDGRISGCAVDGGSVSGVYDTGGLVGENYKGTISNCYAMGNVSGFQQIGGLVGDNWEGTISNCYATGTISGDAYVGGLVGYNHYGTISNCHATGSVSGDFGVGGLVGGNGGTIEKCYATGAVSGYDCIAGLVAYNHYGTISNCYATGSASGICERTGGLVGHNYYGTISNCYATGDVSGDDETGGLVGRNGGTISNCYATGNVSGVFVTGGLVGHNGGTIEKCYATGSVTGYSRTGGLVGGRNDEGTVTAASFWDIETSGQESSAGGVGKTTAEMQTESTFTDANWDFVDIWDICEGTNYPRLVWQIPVGDFLCPDGVNFVDFAFFANRWMDDNCGDSNDCDGTDIDFSDTVDMADLQIFCQHWLEGAGQ